MFIQRYGNNISTGQPLDFNEFKVVFIYYTLLYDRASILDVYYDITCNNGGGPMTAAQFTVCLSRFKPYRVLC